MDEKKITQMPKRMAQKGEQMPPEQQMPTEDVANNTTTTQPSELEIRAQNEMAMLQRTAQKKQMQAQMKPKIDEKVVSRASEILREYKKGKQLYL